MADRDSQLCGSTHSQREGGKDRQPLGHQSIPQPFTSQAGPSAGRSSDSYHDPHTASGAFSFTSSHMSFLPPSSGATCQLHKDRVNCLLFNHVPGLSGTQWAVCLPEFRHQSFIKSTWQHMHFIQHSDGDKRSGVIPSYKLSLRPA